jgi:hypothetical protein
MIYTTSQVQQQLPDLLKKALLDGQIWFKTRDGQVFLIKPVVSEKASNKSPLDVRSVKLPITTNDILLAVRESRERYG